MTPSLPRPLHDMLGCSSLVQWPITCIGFDLHSSFAAAYRNLGQNLWGPHRYGCLSGVRVRTVISGSCAAHSLLITTEGKLWSWGKLDVGYQTHPRCKSPGRGLVFCLDLWLLFVCVVCACQPVCDMWRSGDNLGAASCLLCLCGFWRSSPRLQVYVASVYPLAHFTGPCSLSPGERFPEREAGVLFLLPSLRPAICS